jgi:hypothetical protein
LGKQTANAMTNNEIADLIEQMPQGMTADDFIIELVNRALSVQAKDFNKRISELQARISLLIEEVNWVDQGYRRTKDA